MNESQKLIQTIQRSIIGHGHQLDGPFGHRLVTYADYTASGKSLTFIEDFIRDNVMPYYANTHTESSGTGLQTTCFREDARAIIHQAVNGGPDDVVIFTGSGATAAINKLVSILNLRIPEELDDKYHLSELIPKHQRPVVFIGPYEHHSNELPWRESIADVVTIDEDENGKPDLALLEAALVAHADRPLKIGSFSAASNVTGIGTGTSLVTRVLHKHGALAFWDFAAAGPYVQIDMNRTQGDPDDYKDAVFLSPHKFVGGPGTPGLLIVKKGLLNNRVPSIPGGGTVAYVGPTEHRYLGDPAHREEGGTPAIIGAIRAGLVFQLKDAVGVDNIRAREHSFLKRAYKRWDANPNIRILGNHEAWRLSIISFMLRHGERYLHHNFVVSLLNDLFGIQVRGGCSCAGPYGHRLLGIDLVKSSAYRKQIVRGCEGIKPGWVRMNFNYFISDAAFEYLVEAIDFVATEGWRFLPLYHFESETGLWGHRRWQHEPRMRLSDVRYREGAMTFRHCHSITDETAYAGYLENARQLASKLPGDADPVLAPDALSDDLEQLRWFPLPGEMVRADAHR